IEWTDAQDMFVHHLNKEAFNYLNARDSTIASLETKSDWLSRQKKVKSILMKIVGPFPQKTPLNSKITGTVQEDGYSIDKVIYQSIPNFYVTGCLFIPDGIKGKMPAILFVSGHEKEAFRVNAYQTMILQLVKQGFIVFAIDPISQGERVQLYDTSTKASIAGGSTPTMEHNYLGRQCLVTGASLSRYFIWDGIRGIDYLLTRKEVDPSRIGITGQSGGGTQTAYIYAFDQRIKAAASVNYVTSSKRLLESIGPQDAEQNFYHGILNGITYADLLEVRAPAPFLIGAGTRDFFSIQGTRETYAEVKKAYKALGENNNISKVEDDWVHGYTPKLREAVCVFFLKQFNMAGTYHADSVKILNPKILQVTPTGQVATSFKNAETVFSINEKAAEKLTKRLRNSGENVNQQLCEVRIKAKTLSGYITPHYEANSIFCGRYKRSGYSVEMYVLHGEKNSYVIPLLLFVPEKRGNSSALIYLNPKEENADAVIGGKIERLVKEGYVVASPDVIGTGETSPSRGNVPMLAMLIGRSVPGIQAGDVVRVVEFLKNRKYINPNRIGGIAFGEMCPTLLYAATFDRSINSIVLDGSPVSYASMIKNEFYNTELFKDNTVAGALTAFDLPDLMGCVAPRKLALVDLKNQMGEVASRELTDESLLFPIRAYTFKRASDNLRVLTSKEDISSGIDWSLK
ncbi:MAG: alpha/beta hydrolase family protein, partial [Ginsengibacter sp.]